MIDIRDLSACVASIKKQLLVPILKPSSVADKDLQFSLLNCMIHLTGIFWFGMQQFEDEECQQVKNLLQVFKTDLGKVKYLLELKGRYFSRIFQYAQVT